MISDLVRSPGRVAARYITRSWKPFSRLFIVGDGHGWVISEEQQSLAETARRIGIRVGHPKLRRYSSSQAAFYCDHFSLIDIDWRSHPHKLATAYFHGRPGTGSEQFDHIYNRLSSSHQYLERIQVSHSYMYELVLETGIAEEKVFQIPIGIDISSFPPVTEGRRAEARRKYRIPETAFVVGSFQKDGVGWGGGTDPKLIKGPDVLLETLGRLSATVPELFVFLTGPSRGFVKAGLDKINVPYRHIYLQDYSEISQCYHALNAYIVSSRDEGGPKAVLESMATGVPLVTTKVGQAVDLVEHDVNGWIVDVEDFEGLAYWTQRAQARDSDLETMLQNARKTAEENSHHSQQDQWREFMTGFVEW